MRISDWSSDVCSSDLIEKAARRVAQTRGQLTGDLEYDVRILAVELHERVIIQFRCQRRRARAHDCGARLLLWKQAQLTEEITGIEIGEDDLAAVLVFERSEEHTSELQSLMRISYAVFGL